MKLSASAKRHFALAARASDRSDVDGNSAINYREVMRVKLMGLRDKRLWLPLILGAIAALVALVFVVSGFVGGRDYTGVPVADLPLEEQIKVARSVKLSAIVNWGEGGNLYCREVAEAFLLGHPYPEHLDETYGEFKLFSPWGRSRGAIAFLSQHTLENTNTLGQQAALKAYVRVISLYTNSGIYQIILGLDRRGRILYASNNFQPSP